MGSDADPISKVPTVSVDEAFVFTKAEVHERRFWRKQIPGGLSILQICVFIVLLVAVIVVFLVGGDLGIPVLGSFGLPVVGFFVLIFAVKAIDLIETRNRPAAKWAIDKVYRKTAQPRHVRYWKTVRRLPQAAVTVAMRLRVGEGSHAGWKNDRQDR